MKKLIKGYFYEEEYIDESEDFPYFNLYDNKGNYITAFPSYDNMLETLKNNDLEFYCKNV